MQNRDEHKTGCAGVKICSTTKIRFTGLCGDGVPEWRNNMLNRLLKRVEKTNKYAGDNGCVKTN